ncbi:unnamed protein product [Protopolystoma xenopodis]|uniref:UspA domain-containing protein n=1 Tax=Protopolystoma xenopodis TaxID=117903 RepID=A0A3S4ZWF7_9PLAT|nr:unnamed protein product [Protopolystoma xenopodis]
MTSTRHVLLAVDGNEYSERAFYWYIRHLAKPGDQLALLQILPHHNAPATEELVSYDQQPARDGSNRDQILKAQNLYNDYGERLMCTIQQDPALSDFLKDQMTYRAYVKRSSNIGAGIVDTQNRLGVDIIVMGTRSLNMLKRTFLGSVSDYVLHHATVPVAVVPPPAEHE